MTKDAPEQKRMRGVIRLLAIRSQRCAAVVRRGFDERLRAAAAIVGDTASSFARHGSEPPPCGLIRTDVQP